MAHMPPQEFNDMLKRLRAGEKVICPLCGKGTMIPAGNRQTTHGFHCSHCQKKLNIN